MREHDGVLRQRGVLKYAHQRFDVVGQFVVRARHGFFWIDVLGKTLLNHLLDLRGLNVAHDHDRHGVGAIPAFVKIAQQFGRGTLNHRGLTHRNALGVARAFGGDFQIVFLLMRHCALRAGAPFFHNHRALLLHFGGIKGGVKGQFLHDVQAGRQIVRIVQRNRQDVDGFVKAGIGVEVCAELHAHFFQGINHLIARIARGAVEHHVFQKVCHAALVFVLVDRTGAYRQTQLDHARRLGVAQDVVFQTVFQLTASQGRIGRDDLRHFGGRDALRGGAARIERGFLGPCGRERIHQA